MTKSLNIRKPFCGVGISYPLNHVNILNLLFLIFSNNIDDELVVRLVVLNGVSYARENSTMNDIHLKPQG
ncbi:hypothetical protein BCON_0292g00020 [Botryotinia convoluta]|uniref:Uncharacterized protein n=1 Tax=Botryotinia convoluta TaxID=54673 RepID=A0A4Z1HK27_9HELO|nr:hypothetical protein BCON_0292g00020 [Botryotinia convoluta]